MASAAMTTKALTEGAGQRTLLITTTSTGPPLALAVALVLDLGMRSMLLLTRLLKVQKRHHHHRRRQQHCQGPQEAGDVDVDVEVVVLDAAAALAVKMPEHHCQHQGTRPTVTAAAEGHDRAAVAVAVVVVAAAMSRRQSDVRLHRLHRHDLLRSPKSRALPTSLSLVTSVQRCPHFTLDRLCGLQVNTLLFRH